MLQNYVVYLKFKINWVFSVLSDKLPQGSYSFQPGKWGKESGQSCSTWHSWSRPGWSLLINEQLPMLAASHVSQFPPHCSNSLSSPWNSASRCSSGHITNLLIILPNSLTLSRSHCPWPISETSFIIYPSSLPQLRPCCLPSASYINFGAKVEFTRASIIAQRRKHVTTEKSWISFKSIPGFFPILYGFTVQGL